MKYITLQEFRDYSKFSIEDISDPIANILIDGAEDFIDNYTRTKFIDTPETIKIQGTGSDKVYINKAPLNSITTITADGNIIDLERIETKGLIYLTRSYSEDTTLEISLTYGHNPTPNDLKFTLLDLVTDLAGNKINKEDTKGAKKKKIGKMYEVEVRDDNEIYNSYKDKIRHYRVPLVRRG